MGKGTVSMSLRAYAVLVATVNDNTAANLLTALVGRDNINASLSAQGTPEIKFQPGATDRPKKHSSPPSSIGTPRAVMRALELLNQGKVVNQATSDAIVELLALPELSFSPRHLPSGARMAGQAGSGPPSAATKASCCFPAIPIFSA